MSSNVFCVETCLMKSQIRERKNSFPRNEPGERKLSLIFLTVSNHIDNDVSSNLLRIVRMASIS